MTTLWRGCLRCVFYWRHRTHFNNRLDDGHLSVNKLRCSASGWALLQLDWLESVTQRLTQQLCIIGRPPLNDNTQSRCTHNSNYFEMPSVLWRCWLGGRKGIWPVKNWVVGCWRGCLGRGADLHMVQLMPLPLTISCFSKIQIVLPLWYWLIQPVIPDKIRRAVKTVACMCVEMN